VAACAILGIGELAAVEREAAAADAFGEAGAQALELGDARVNERSAMNCGVASGPFFER
jgi:hypothetical protein